MKYSLITGKNVPTGFSDSLNWACDTCNPLNKSVLGKIKNQGQCGSCWDFGTTCGIEAAISMEIIKNPGTYNTSGNNYVSLSEQYTLIHTTWQDNGCNGGLFELAVPEIQLVGAVTTASCPYTSGSGIVAGKVDTSQCGDAETVINTDNDIKGFVIHLWDISSSATLAKLDNQDIKNLLLIYGPLVVAIDAANSLFQSLTNNILTPRPFGGSVRPDHQVVFIGYGKSDSGTKYWIIRNSWDDSWGNNGYGAIKMNDDPTKIFSELGAITKVSFNSPLIKDNTHNESLNK